jgi:AAA domain
MSALTEKAAIEQVQEWVAVDKEFPGDEQTQEQMLDQLRQIAIEDGSEIADSTLVAIVKVYAPEAEALVEIDMGDEPEPAPVAALTVSPLSTKATPPETSDVPYPSELEPLVKSGLATYDSGYWLVPRCGICGQFNKTCCGVVYMTSAVRLGELVLTASGRQAVGLDPIKKPTPPKTAEHIKAEQLNNLDKTKWWSNFRSVSELEGSGSLKMLIENVLPADGIALICGLPKEGKSFLALSIAKALTTGKPLFGRVGYEVPEPVPVLYLAAESKDGLLKLRCRKMGLTDDKTKFIARTLSQGIMLSLSDPVIEDIVKAMKPVVILETLIRFNDGTDEDSSTENRKLAQSLFQLLGWGASAVIGIHHSRKDLNKAKPTKESAVRGSGDGLAMVDAVWLIMQDEKLHQKGRGPNEVDVIGWARDFNPVGIRLALTAKAQEGQVVTFAPGIVSVIDQTGDFGWVSKAKPEKPDAVAKVAKVTPKRLEQMVIDNPLITVRDLAKETGKSAGCVSDTLKRLGYHRKPGYAGEWKKAA